MQKMNKIMKKLETEFRGKEWLRLTEPERI